MKKIIAVMMCTACLFTFAACRSEDGNISNNSSSLFSSSKSDTSSYPNNSSGLESSSVSSGLTDGNDSSSLNQELNSSDSGEVYSSGSAASFPEDAFDDTAFSDFEKKLDDMDLKYTKSEANAGLANASKGVTYTFDKGGKVELYMFTDNNVIESIANNLTLTIEGLGEMPVEMNSNLTLLAGDAPKDMKDKIIQAFKEL